MSPPLVSVCVTTYNHREYIEQCLDSILAQRVPFDFEIVLGEDESTDGTREICVQYARRYAGRIRLLLNSRDNVFYFRGRPTGQWNFLNNLEQARGTYVALLEGDDYWCDDTKLERQVALLDARPDLSGSFHACRVAHSDGSPPERIAAPPGKTLFGLEDILRKNFAATSSVVYRRVGLRIPTELWAMPVGDQPLHMLNLLRGPYQYLDRTMSVYRVHPGGAWSQLERRARLEGSMMFYRFAEDVVSERHSALVRRMRRRYRFRQSTPGRWLLRLRKRLQLRSRLRGFVRATQRRPVP